MTLDSLTVVAEVDQYPDLSYLGTFRDQPGPDDRTIDREARGVRGRGEKRYFVAAHGPDETGNPESVEEDWQRMEAYGSTWCHLGIRAVATVTINGTTQTLKSNGIYGVESDAPDDYLNRLAREELAELRTVLDNLGIEVSADRTVEWDGSPYVNGIITG